jgi:hypothetical protein
MRALASALIALGVLASVAWGAILGYVLLSLMWFD